MAEPSWVIVLVEDERQQRFVRNYLYRRGLTRHDISFEPLPDGKGSGEQWVRRRYPNAVRAYRSRSAHAQTALVVAIDADTKEVDARQRQLEKVLAENSIPNRTPNEAIVHWIPKRNIETWILCLGGIPGVSEQQDYRNDRAVKGLIVIAAEAFFDMNSSSADLPDCLPSLRVAITEAQRLGAPRNA